MSHTAAPPLQTELTLGTIAGTNIPFKVPIDLVGRTNAVIGQSGCGKTCAVAVIEEELLRVGQPFSVLDTVGVHLGLRAFPDGRPSNFPVVVFGGKRGDLPINEAEIGFGERLAEIVSTSKIPTVIDLSRTAHEVRFRIVAEFARTLMDNESPDARHIFIEESPEFLPETVEFKAQDKARAEMTRLVTLGRNNGYTVTLVGQRWATIRKTCLAQVKNFFIMRTNIKDDRKRLQAVFEEIAPEQNLDDIFRSMGKLEDGEAWFASPQWLKQVVKVRFNVRKTFHPGETRHVGVKLNQVDMGDVQKFVSELAKVLSKKAAVVPKEPGAIALPPVAPKTSPLLAKKLQEAEEAYKDVVVQKDDLQRRLNAAEAQNRVLSEKLSNARTALAQLYQPLKKLFDDTQEVEAAAGGSVDVSKYEPFLRRAGKYSARKMLEIMMKEQRIHKNQLRTLCAIRNTSYSTAQRWMVRTKLMAEDGEFWVFTPLT